MNRDALTFAHGSVLWVVSFSARRPGIDNRAAHRSESTRNEHPGCHTAAGVSCFGQPVDKHVDGL